jgi:hypothetical protein
MRFYECLSKLEKRITDCEKAGKDAVIEEVKKYPLEIVFFSEKYREDMEFMTELALKCPKAMKFMSKETIDKIYDNIKETQEEIEI